MVNTVGVYIGHHKFLTCIFKWQGQIIQLSTDLQVYSLGGFSYQSLYVSPKNFYFHEPFYYK